VSACHHCGKPLKQAKTGRPRRYCNESCKARAKRRKRGLGALFRGAPKLSSAKPVGPAAPETTSERQAPEARKRAEALRRALADVERYEQALAEARAARAALDAEPDPLEQPHEFRTYGSVEEMRAAHGGAVFNPGIDTSEAAEAIRRQLEAER
jgi:hypothetical protein